MKNEPQFYSFFIVFRFINNHWSPSLVSNLLEGMQIGSQSIEKFSTSLGSGGGRINDHL